MADLPLPANYEPHDSLESRQQGLAIRQSQDRVWTVSVSAIDRSQQFNNSMSLIVVSAD